ncbi:MAG: WcaI family glycosyltransferase [Thermomicrobiales bacterium]
MSGLKVTIYGLNYWPEPTGNAPYTTALAEHLVEHGAEVMVKAGMPYYPYWSIPSEYGKALRDSEVRNGVSLHRFRQYVPARQSAIRRLGFEGSFLVNAMLSRTAPGPDVVVGIIPALADGVLALMTARRFRVPMVLIVQDLMGSAAEQSGVSGGARVAVATSKLEAWICRHAAEIGVVSTGFRDRLIRQGVAPERIHITRNWSHIDRPTQGQAEVRAHLGLPQDRFIALHAGNMGLKQGLDHLIEAARIAQETSPHLLFVLMGDGNQRERLQQVAIGLDNVRFLPPQESSLFPSILAASDALLVNQLPTVTDMSLPSKLTSYFSVSRPVVAAVSPQSETAKVIDESGGGLLVDPSDPAALVSTLESLSLDPGSAQALGERGIAYATSHLSADAALANLEQLIHSARRRAVADTKELATT